MTFFGTLINKLTFQGVNSAHEVIFINCHINKGTIIQYGWKKILPIHFLMKSCSLHYVDGTLAAQLVNLMGTQRGLNLYSEYYSWAITSIPGIGPGLDKEINYLKFLNMPIWSRNLFGPWIGLIGLSEDKFQWANHLNYDYCLIRGIYIFIFKLFWFQIIYFMHCFIHIKLNPLFRVPSEICAFGFFF
ncbi:hypothetical protein ACJX0J_007748, partial [Zea mays]